MNVSQEKNKQLEINYNGKNGRRFKLGDIVRYIGDDRTFFKFYKQKIFEVNDFIDPSNPGRTLFRCPECGENHSRVGLKDCAFVICPKELVKANKKERFLYKMGKRE